MASFLWRKSGRIVGELGEPLRVCWRGRGGKRGGWQVKKEGELLLQTFFFVRVQNISERIIEISTTGLTQHIPKPLIITDHMINSGICSNYSTTLVPACNHQLKWTMVSFREGDLRKTSTPLELYVWYHFRFFKYWIMVRFVLFPEEQTDRQTKQKSHQKIVIQNYIVTCFLYIYKHYICTNITHASFTNIFSIPFLNVFAHSYETKASQITQELGHNNTESQKKIVYLPRFWKVPKLFNNVNFFQPRFHLNSKFSSDIETRSVGSNDII